MKNCSGCGVELQNRDETKDGYIINLEHDYCKRCFDLLHYNKLPEISLDDIKYERVINKILTKNNLYLYLVDIFRFSISFNHKILAKFKDKDVILVINKIDLLPKSFKLENIINFIEKKVNKTFFKTLGIFLISGLKAYYLEDLLRFIDHVRKDRNVYLMGVANSGKSTLINRLIKEELNNNQKVATSYVPGTTLDVIPFHFFSDHKAIYDTPGFINRESYEYLLDSKYLKLLNPTKEVKAISYKVEENVIYKILDLVQIKAEYNSNASIVFYLSDKVNITKQQEKNVNFYLNKISFNLDNKSKVVYFPGFGFIIVNNIPKITIYTVVKMEVRCYDSFTRRAISNC